MEVVVEEDLGGKRVVFLDIFELRYRVRNNLQIAKNEEASVTTAGPFHGVRSSSPARLYEPTMSLPR